MILASGTAWRVPWDLIVHGPFESCALLDGPHVRHLTVTSLLTSAVRRRSSPDTPIDPNDHARLPVFAADMSLVDAAMRVVGTGWELAVVLDQKPRIVAARSVYRSLVATGLIADPTPVLEATPQSDLRPRT